jgi:hypothetical protein
MTDSPVTPENGAKLKALRVALARSGLTNEELWQRYFALGGDAGPIEMEAYLHGLMDLPSLQRDMLAHAVNERLDEVAWAGRAPYTHGHYEGKSSHGPLAALVDLLGGMHLAPPERIASVTAAAGKALDAAVAVYVVDYEQHTLVPLPGMGADVEACLNVDSTMAGRAFRNVATVDGTTGGRRTLWVPLLDGVERLGVLAVVPQDSAAVDDPAFQDQCRWLSMLAGHLVVATTKYGDAVDRVRRRRRRSPAAELIWQMLPPTTAGTDTIILSAMVEPSYDVGGDAFDYALSERTAQMAIFDASGHSLTAGMAAATALATYRSVRRNGGALFDQAARVDDTITEHFGDDKFVTGVLVELDLTSGRLRYINAGHPSPMLLRDGRVVKRLTQGHRPMFGLPISELSIGEEVLEPGDWLVLHTDGIVEARDGEGSLFGEERLVDFLERESAAGHPPPETVRRLTQAVLEHQKGVLQDDATVLLARWQPAPELVTSP